MPDSHVRFHSATGKRQILIVDDEAINREMLGATLEERYDLIYAATGAEALETVRQNVDSLSLVLLDLLLPDMHGLDILRTLKSDVQLARIPVIVMTSDKEAEVESLTIGAIDFIPKPYPLPKVMLARVRRTIELCEDRDIIRWTERDHLTGLYNREYFYRYAEQFDKHHKDMSMDAIVVDINHFHMINERYGKAYGDQVLTAISGNLREAVGESGGIVCRREADTFLIYCPHRTDYSAILEKASLGLSSNARVRLRMGVYSDADKGIDIERRLDRAKLAADTVRSSFTKTIAIYDNTLHESELFAEQLLEDFHEAIKQRQFTVYYQPKFNIQGPEPFLNSAEALVRWKHPELGMISPGVFIPLFESNGLIQQLDAYVWEETARKIREWKERLGISVPVSVNVSRVDIFDPDLVDHIERLVQENGLDRRELLLEITESAYTQDSDQLIETVNRLRERGYYIEMDDFGSGYSSLSMISTLPVDALKLDMQFIRNAFKDRKNTRMLEVVIDLAESLSVPTVAEGVETAEQLLTLKAMGCDIVQGYYFSRPLPAHDFEVFLLQKKNTPQAEAPVLERKRRDDHPAAQGQFTYSALHDPLTGLYNRSAFEMLLKDADLRHIAVLVADIDGYKSLRETLGAADADRVILRVAAVLRSSFRSVDYVCRVGPSEFVIIMTRVTSALRDMLFDKVEQVNDKLNTAYDELPAIALSVGVAFGDRANPQGDILQDANTALNRMKEMRRCGCAVY